MSGGERVRSLFRRLGLGPRRRCHVFGVGMAKTGTTSLAGLFAGTRRSAHEPDATGLAELILARGDGSLVEGDVRGRLRERAARLDLEVDVSQLNGFVVADLVALYPDAHFVLTIRNPLAWLQSFVDDQLRRDPPLWRRMKEHRFARPGLVHPPAERTLADAGLYTLEAYLSYWERHNQAVLDAVPAERLLVVRTDEIGDRLADLAAVAGLAERDLDTSRLHANRAPTRSELLAAVPRDHLLGVARRCAAEGTERWFPGSLDA